MEITEEFFIVFLVILHKSQKNEGEEAPDGSKKLGNALGQVIMVSTETRRSKYMVDSSLEMMRKIKKKGFIKKEIKYF